jgi:hypothetical protein
MEKKNDKNLPRRCLNDNPGTMGKYSYQYNIPRVALYIYTTSTELNWLGLYITKR